MQDEAGPQASIRLHPEDITAIATEVVKLLRGDEPREEKPRPQELKPWDRAEFLRAQAKGGKALAEYLCTHEVPCEAKIRRVG